MTDDIQSVTESRAGEADQDQRGVGLERFAVTGGILGAVAASTCCVVPLGLAVFGVGGAWVSGLRAFAPYQPFFLALAAGAIGYGFYRVYWKTGRACEADEACARPLPNGFVKPGLWLASAMVTAVITFPYWLPLIEPYLP